MAEPLTIVFLSDYGVQDEFAGTCHAVIARIAPQTRVIDLTHSVPPQDVVRGAVLLADSVQYVPEGTVFLAVVDPGVGTGRRGVAVQAASGNLLVGPDNGLLSLAWERLGGAARATEIRSPHVLLLPVSPTFHGRDVFAPAAAHLSSGMSLSEIGPEVDPSTLVSLSLPRPKVRPGRIASEVLSIDRYGNVELNVREDELEAAGLDGAPEVRVVARGSTVRASMVTTFGDVPLGDYAVIIDSRGWVGVARNGSSAAEGLGVTAEDRIVLEVPDDAGVTGAPKEAAPPSP